jgi:hypothetical protein
MHCSTLQMFPALVRVFPWEMKSSGPLHLPSHTNSKAGLLGFGQRVSLKSPSITHTKGFVSLLALVLLVPQDKRQLLPVKQRTPGGRKLGPSWKDALVA